MNFLIVNNYTRKTNDELINKNIIINYNEL